MRVVHALPWVGAVLFGALAPGLVVAGLSGDIRLLPLAFAVTLGHSLILGLPIALLYRAMRWTRLTASIAGGFLIGAIPGGLVAWPVSLALRTTASVNGVPTIIDGVPTLAGWLQFFGFVGLLGGLGATGAIVFWLIIRWSGVFGTMGADSRSPPVGPIRSVTSIVFAAIAIMASAAIAAIPAIMKDRTCHNMFRDGRTSIAPRVDIDLDIDQDDWPRLTERLQQFSTQRAMSFRNSSKSQPTVVEILGLSACTEQGLVITANQQRWTSPEYNSPMADRGVSVSVFNLGEGDSWRPLGRDLVTALESEWREKVRFRDGGGQLVAKPSVLGTQNGAPPAQ